MALTRTQKTKITAVETALAAAIDAVASDDVDERAAKSTLQQMQRLLDQQLRDLRAR